MKTTRSQNNVAQLRTIAKIQIVNKNNNNKHKVQQQKKRINNKQKRLGYLNSLELYNVTMHKKVHRKICRSTMVPSLSQPNHQIPINVIREKSQYRRM